MVLKPKSNRFEIVQLRTTVIQEFYILDLITDLNIKTAMFEKR